MSDERDRRRDLSVRLGISQQTALAIDAWFDKHLDLRNRALTIQDNVTNLVVDSDGDVSSPGIDYTVSDMVRKGLALLRAQSEDEPITIYLQSPGGDYVSGIDIYDDIKITPCHIDMICRGEASSMASIILQAADTRIMMPSAELMLHQMQVALPRVSLTIAKSRMEMFKRAERVCNAIYCQRLRKSKVKAFRGRKNKKIIAELSRLYGTKGEIYIDAEQAVKWNLADGILVGWEDRTPIYK